MDVSRFAGPTAILCSADISVHTGMHMDQQLSARELRDLQVEGSGVALS